MSFTELLLWKNQKGLTYYLMTLYKRDSTADIFLKTFKFFFDNVFYKTALTTNCKGFLFVRISNDYCFRRVAQGQQLQCYKRNTAIVLRAVVKSQYLPWVFWKKSKKFLKTYREEPVLESFYFIVGAWNTL